MRYTTGKYLRDAYPFLDAMFDLISWLNNGLKTILNALKENITKIGYKKLLSNAWHNYPYGLIIVYLGFLLTFILFINTESKNGVRVVTITTSSMEPVITPGSIIITDKHSNYKVGDIITYREVSRDTGVVFSRTLTHRIVDIRLDEDVEKAYFITKGDANALPDPYEVEPEQILGKVNYIIPWIGYLFFFVKTVPGFIVLVVLPVMILLKNEIGYLKRQFG